MVKYCAGRTSKRWGLLDKTSGPLNLVTRGRYGVVDDASEDGQPQQRDDAMAIVDNCGSVY